MRICSIEGCERKHKGHGLCDAHCKLKMRSENPEYSVWLDIKRRCYNINCKRYKDYGGRGLEVHASWLHNYHQFLKDMGPRPSKYHSIERVNNNKGYTPENCRWATLLEQANNKRSNRNITFRGKTQTLAQWTRELNINSSMVRTRIYSHKWSVERALTTPKTRSYDG